MKNRETSLNELFKVIWKGKYLIIIISVALTIFVAVGSLVYDRTTSQVSTIVTMQWDGISKGEYPNGYDFNYNEMIESSVLSEAISESGFVLDAAELSRSLYIKPIIPTDTLQLLEQSLKDGDPLLYYATNYKLTINTGELGISVSQGETLMNNIVSIFSTDFERKYINQAIILDYTGIDFDLLDYGESYEVLSKQADLITSAMETKLLTGTKFVSPSLNIGFNDILIKIQLLYDVEINQIGSRTKMYSLTKDVDYLIDKYSLEIEENQLRLDKILSQETDIYLLLANYEGSLISILIPGVDSTELLEIDSYYSTLIENILVLQEEKSELENDIIYTESLISKLDGTDLNFTISQATQTIEKEKVEALIDISNTKTALFLKDANTLLLEYNAISTGKIIKQLSNPQYESSVSILLFSAAGLILGAGVGVVIVLFKQDWDK